MTGEAEEQARESAPSAEHGLDLAAGLVVAGKYRLESVIRRGGMGAVWRATHTDLDTPVAIKFMRKLEEAASEAPGADSVSRETRQAAARGRFEREARAAAHLRMSNVVQILDYGVDHFPYLVMELLEGEDLGARIQRDGHLDLAALQPVVAGVARALQRAHDEGIVHRDLKPENIFLAKDGDLEIPKVLDFGVAKAIAGGDRRVDPTSTSEGTVVGTPYYMSPEQAVGQTDIDARSDLWSLGVVLFHALTGQLPFVKPTLLEAVVAICTAPVPRPSSLAARLSPDVDRFFERALDREPARRFASAREMAAAFVELGRPSTRKRWHRPAIGAAVLAAALLGAGIAVTASSSVEPPVAHAPPPTAPTPEPPTPPAEPAPPGTSAPASQSDSNATPPPTAAAARSSAPRASQTNSKMPNKPAGRRKKVDVGY